MKVHELIDKIKDLPPDKEIVVQRNHGEYFSHHKLVLQLSGHPGHSGPVIHAGADIDEGSCANCEGAKAERGPR